MKKLWQITKVSALLCWTLLCIVNGATAQGTAAPQTAAQVAQVINEQLNNPLIKYINRIDKTVRSKNLFTAVLTAQHLDKLPIGIIDPTGMVVICIDSAKFGPGGATFNAYAAITIPGQKTKACFRATGISFGPNGLTGTGQGLQLKLVSTHVLSKPKFDLVLPGNGNNNVTWDCNGFKEANLEGYALFKDWLFVPDPVEAPNDINVKATIKVEHITDFSNMVASLNITPFKLKGKEDYAFKVTDATYDMSDHFNPAGFTLPQEYNAEYGSNANLWRGFYLKNVQVRTPFNKAGGYAKIGASDMMIDDHGFTGRIYGRNLINIDEGNMDGWVFSLDTLNIDLLRSRLKFGEAMGGLRVPFLGSDSLGYRLAVQEWDGQWDYLLNVGLREDAIHPCPVGNAKVKLIAGSYVEIHKPAGEKFLASAYLNGAIMKDNGVAQFNWMRFENVRVSTRSPYLHSGVFSLDGLDLESPKVGGFKVSLNSVGFGLYSGQAVLKFGMGLSFSDEADHGFGVRGGFRLLANIEKGPEPDAKQTWSFAGVKVDSIGINVETGAFDLDGLVQFFENDGVYGNGFRGALTLKLLKSSLNITVSAGAYFGNKNGLKYWQVSAYAAAGTIGIPVGPGIFMNGFMGGVAYHMRKPNRFMVTPNMMDSVTYNPISSVEDWARQIYVPDAGSGISVMVGTTLYVVKQKLLSASVALEVGFNTSGGLNFVQFNGYATLLKDITGISPATVVKGDFANEAAFTATVSILYDRPNKTFHANVSAYMDLIVLRGAGPGNRLGELVIHADPNQWYVYVGRPTSPLGAKLQLAGVDFVTVQTYFMFGKLLDPFPAPPTEVTSVINYTPQVDAARLQNGNGVALGARFRAGAGFDWGWLYAGIWLGAGGDIMFSNTGNATCDGSPVGFGGWWARGQVYAWLQGGVGVRVKVFGKKKDFKIVELAAAVLLEAKVPKPSWFRGHVGVRWSLLGGLIKGNINMSVKVGKECQYMTGTGINNETPVARDLVAKVLTGVSPAGNPTGVSIYSTPAIAVNIPVDSVFSQLDDMGNEQKYKMKLDMLKLYKGTEEVPGYISYTPEKKMAYFIPSKRLLPDANYRVQAVIYCKKQLASSGYWTDALDENGNPTREDTGFTFKTAPPSDVLTMADIEYAYPLAEMKNFYKNEYSPGQGYLKVNGNVNFEQVFYPGTPGSGVTYSYQVKIKSVTPGDGYQPYYKPINRAEIANHLIKFNLPGIENGKVYRFSIVRIADDGSGGAMAGGSGSGQVVNSQGFNPGDSSVAFSDTTVANVISGQVSQKETEVLGYHFRVSKFNTFLEKINTMTAVAENQQDLAEGNVVLVATKNNIEQELFDEFEISDPYNTQGSYEEESMVLVGKQLGGGTEDGRLIRLVAEIDNPWLESDIMPLIYPRDIASTIGESYYRDVVAQQGGVANYSGIVPLKKITAEHSPKPSLPLTTEPYERMSVTGQPGSSKLMLKYNLPFFANRDFTALYIRAMGYWVTAPLADKTPTFSRMVATGGIFPQIRPGSYNIKFSYHVPGVEQPTAVKVLPVVYQ
jgi:hypothetical protein